MVDAPDLGSGEATRGGSSPFSRTINIATYRSNGLSLDSLDSIQALAPGAVLELVIAGAHVGAETYS